MNNWGANHGAISYGHIGGQLITLASMLRIPVNMHNVPEERIFRPKAWSLFGTESLEAADFRACAHLRPDVPLMQRPVRARVSSLPEPDRATLPGSARVPGRGPGLADEENPHHTPNDGTRRAGRILRQETFNDHRTCC